MKLNICIISQEFPPHTNWGGIAIYNSEFSNIYRELGHRITVISRSSLGAPEFERLPNGISVWRVGSTIRRKLFVGRTIDRILHSKDVYRKVRELDAQNSFDIIETTETCLEGEALLRDPFFSNRMIIQCNGSNAQGQVPDGLLSPLHRIDWGWSTRREIASLHLTPVIIITSNATRRILLDQGIPEENIQLIYQGINTDLFCPGEQQSYGPLLEVAFVGRLEMGKGIDFIWKVMSKIEPNSRIRFHLKGAIHKAWKKDIEKEIERFSGMCVYHPSGGHKDMPDFYRSMHVLLQPSRFENFGLVYAEGMASGLVVFAGRKGGGSEIVEDGATGFLIDPDTDGDVDKVVSTLKEIVSNPDAFAKMRKAARESIVRRFSLKKCAAEKIAVYQEVASSKQLEFNKCNQP